MKEWLARSMEENGDSSSYKCVTVHPSFAALCLDKYVLQNAYYAFRTQYRQTVVNAYTENA